MANDVLTPDIYEISELVDSIKAKYIDLPEDTLMMGMYGYPAMNPYCQIQNGMQQNEQTCYTV